MRVRGESGLAAVVGLSVCALYFAPEHLASRLALYQPGLEYIAAGIEAAALWIFAASVAFWLGCNRVAVVALWPAYEAALRVAGRLAFPLDKPVRLPPGHTMIETAYGEWTSWIGFAVAFLATAYVIKGLAHGRANTSG